MIEPVSSAPPRRASHAIILQVVPTLKQGGVERTTIDIARALHHEGFAPIVASEGGAMEKELSYTGAILEKLPVASKNPIIVLINALRLSSLIRRKNISLIHARSRAPAWSALLAARLTRIPFVTTYHGIYNATNPLKRWYNSVMARGDVVIANSKWTAEHIKETYGFKPKLLAIIPRGIELDRFNPTLVSKEDVALLREHWSRGERNAFIVLLPGRMTRWKGHLVLIAALAKLLAAERMPPNLRVIIIGDDSNAAYVDELRAAVATNGLGDIVTLDGPHDDMPAVYQASDLVVSASIDPEAFGRVIAEASAMAKPVVATDHGGAKETILANKSGFLVKPGDIGALAQAILDVWAMPASQRAVMGQAGQVHIANRYALERMCRDTLSLYSKLLG